MDMPRTFPDWYRAASIQMHGDLVSRRWAGVAAIVKTLTALEAVDLARSFVLGSGIAAPLNQRIVARFQAADSSFGPQGNAHELQVLRGCVLGTLFHQVGCAAADAAGVTIRCLVFSLSNADSVAVPSVLTLADGHLTRRSIELRRRADLTSVPLLLSDFAKQVNPQGRSSAGGVAPRAAAVQKAVDTQARVFRAFARAVQDAVTKQARAIVAQDEELNVLWWLFSGRSRNSHIEFRTLPLRGRCLLAAEELADLTEFDVGLSAAASYLEHVIDKGSEPEPVERLGIQDLVEAVPLDWVEAWQRRRGSNVVTTIESFGEVVPLCFALIQRTRTAEVRGTAASSLKAAEPATHDVVDVSSQFYYEQLFLKCVMRLIKSNG